MFGYLKDLGRYLLKAVPIFNFFVDMIDGGRFLDKYGDDDIYISALNLKNNCKMIVDTLPLIILMPALHEPNILPKALYDSLIITTTSTAVEGVIEHYYDIKKYFKRGVKNER